ncbi:MAG: hypothetical protein Q8R05_02585 [Candidatus Omnitrophota bacterium]|nr:hypothetical protein [Candidatus Omnitrophota bacterium]
MIEDKEDLKIAQERLKSADFVSLKELKKYLKGIAKRRKSSR